MMLVRATVLFLQFTQQLQGHNDNNKVALSNYNTLMCMELRVISPALGTGFLTARSSFIGRFQLLV